MFEIVYNNKPVNDFVVDAVITTVNPLDKEWQDLFSQYANKDITCNKLITDAATHCRYRYFDTLKYLFRGIEKYMPWIRKVHLIVSQPSQVPTWLDRYNDKLNIVYHKDYIPTELLPTFNSTQIEMFMYRIKGLAEHFIYFNDDVFPIKSSSKYDFFTVDGKARMNLKPWPRTLSRSTPHFFRVLANGVNLLKKDYPDFKGHAIDHSVYILLKSLFKEIVEKNIAVIMDIYKDAKVRTNNDICPQLVRDYQFLKGFADKSVLKNYYISLEDTSKIPTKIDAQIACFNDTEKLINNFNKIRSDVVAFLERVLPDKSSFEL